MGNLHVMARQTAQHWHIPLGGLFIQKYIALICAGGWGYVQSWEKRSSVKWGAGPNVNWKVLLTVEETKQRLLACPAWILRLDVPLAPRMNLARPPPRPARGPRPEGCCLTQGRFTPTAPKRASPPTQRFVLVMVAPSQTSHAMGFHPEGFGVSVPVSGVLGVA